MEIYSQIEYQSKQKKKQIAILIDPDKPGDESFESLAIKMANYNIDYILIGGSLLNTNELDSCLKAFRDHTDFPTIIFPGSVMQVNDKAHAILFLSLVSGRNADLLIGRHVESVPYILSAGIEPISTAYILIDGGNVTTAQYISNTMPIPADKPEIVGLTAKAAEMIGMKLIYLDGGSGAKNSVPCKAIKEVKGLTEAPIIVGGGIRDLKTAREKFDAGADIIVVGTALENDFGFLKELMTLKR
ncbi:MAG: geranylgeranylglyceryl/heptaprenylglyceryl phosphate synthase [Bacteroidetes bacterium 4572_77]|nr:MAG: geranylgeranylglyceryl/heptaprenylglyceryl phosphate synthase [Bacteroidetes bacterium 4572_77]